MPDSGDNGDGYRDDGKLDALKMIFTNDSNPDYFKLNPTPPPTSMEKIGMGRTASLMMTKMVSICYVW